MGLEETEERRIGRNGAERQTIITRDSNDLQSHNEGALVNLSINQIKTDGGTQPRAQLDEETVSRYAEAMAGGDKFPPVIVFHDGSQHWLADGFHRVFAAIKTGIDEISSDVRRGTREDALWFALGANRTNGLPPSRGDVRRAVELALKTWPEKTQQAIAEQVGCSQRYVSEIKSQFRASSELPDAPATVIGKDGKTYPASKPRKQVEQQEPEGGEAMGVKKVRKASTVRAAEIAELAGRGMKALDIATRIGISEQQVLAVASNHKINVHRAPAFKAMKPDSRRIVETTVLQMEASAASMEALPMSFDGIPMDEANDWLLSVSASMAVYRKFHNKLKEYCNEA